MKAKTKSDARAGAETLEPPREPAQASAPASASLSWQCFHDLFLARRYELLALALYAFILVLRAPWILFQGRFWAEEGTVYLQYAWTHSFPEAEFEAMYREGLRKRGSYLSQFVEAPRAAAE